MLKNNLHASGSMFIVTSALNISHVFPTFAICTLVSLELIY